MFKLFDLWVVLTTPGVNEVLEMHDSVNLYSFIERHASWDWWDVWEEDATLNNHAVQLWNRILSSYHIWNDKIWIITEADRSVTTILLPDEY